MARQNIQKKIQGPKYCLLLNIIYEWIFHIFVNKSNREIFVVSPCNLLIQMHTIGTSKNSAMKPPFSPIDSLAQLASTFPLKKSIAFRWTQMQYICVTDMMKHFKALLSITSLKVDKVDSDGLYLLFQAREEEHMHRVSNSTSTQPAHCLS